MIHLKKNLVEIILFFIFLWFYGFIIKRRVALALT